MHRRTALSLLLSTAVPAAQAYDAAAMVIASQGTLPLILTAPHDGDTYLGMLPNRTQGTVVRDLGTRPLAERVAALLEERTGKRPYLVIARFSRKHLDANRPPDEAMESPDAMPAYRAYHDRVAGYVAELKANFPGGALLLDVHGQSGDINTTFRGTRAGLTAKALLTRFGPSALQGDNSITGLLAARGYQVHPPVGAATLREDPRYAGGHTVFTYGSHRPDGIDAIQLEFGRNHRDNPRLPHDLTESLLAFMRQYALIA